MKKDELHAAHEKIDALHAQKEKADAAHQIEVERAKAEREALAQLRRPIYDLTEKIEVLREHIANALAKRETWTIYATDFNTHIDAALGSIDPNAVGMLIAGAQSSALQAGFVLGRIDALVARRKDEISQLVTERAKNARENNIEHCLPQ